MIVPREALGKIVKWHNTCIENRIPSRFIPLVVGPSGSGKTYSIKKAIKKYSKDTLLVEVDATTLSAEGWKGLNLSSALGQHITTGKVEEIERLENAIVYIDEIDKISMYGGEAQSGHNKQTQTSLLKWLDKDSESCYITLPGIADTKIPISSGNMTFIFSGAFEDVFKKKKKVNGGIGFNRDDYIEPNTTELTWDDITNIGIIPEITNRINMLLQVEPYSKKQLMDICKSDPSYIFTSLGLGSFIDKDKMAQECIDNGYGARGIAKYVWQEALKKELSNEKI